MSTIKKVIDIYPPGVARDFESGKEGSKPSMGGKREGNSARNRKSFTKPFIGGLIMLAVGIPLVAGFGPLGSVTIAVEPRMEDLQMEVAVVARTGETAPQVEKRIIPAFIHEKTVEGSQIFEATGVREKSEKARGVIRVYNTNTSASQTLVTGSRFISEDGKLFRSANAAKIPAQRQEKGRAVAGEVDIEVIAAETGESYNIEPSNFSLPGLVGSALYTKIYGKSFQSMKGGAESEVPVVTAGDIKNAQDRTVAQLKAKATAQVQSELPESFIAAEESLITEVLESGTEAKEGNELKHFTYSASVEAKILAFKRSDAEALAHTLLDALLKPDEVLEETSFKVVFRGERADVDSGTWLVKFNIYGKKYTNIDLNKVVADFEGKSYKGIQTVLDAYPMIARAEIVFKPFWLQTIPRDTRKIQAALSVDPHGAKLQ